jgi:hypothetical protein
MHGLWHRRSVAPAPNTRWPNACTLATDRPTSACPDSEKRAQTIMVPRLKALLGARRRSGGWSPIERLVSGDRPRRRHPGRSAADFENSSRAARAVWSAAWQERRDSNSQPPVLETRRSDQLSYTPTYMGIVHPHSKWFIVALSSLNRRKWNRRSPLKRYTSDTMLAGYHDFVDVFGYLAARSHREPLPTWPRSLWAGPFSWAPAHGLCYMGRVAACCPRWKPLHPWPRLGGAAP